MLNANSSKPTGKRLKIGFVLDDSLDTPDGVQQYVLTLTTWLKAQGHDVHYLVGATTRTDIANVHSLSRNIKVRFNGNRMSMPLPTSRRRLRALLAEQQFDVLHVQLPFSPFLAGRLITEVPTHTAVVGTFHVAPHSWMVHWANRALHILTRRAWKRFDAIFSVSSVAQAFARRTFHVDSNVIPNTLDLSPFFAGKVLPEYKSVPTIVFLGRLVERKGCQYLLKAVKRMRDERLVPGSYKVVICGKGPLSEQLQSYVREHHLSKIVTFTGFLQESDKPHYLASSDIAIYPSTGGESFGIVLIEAMAASRGMVLAGNNPGYATVMQAFPEALFDPHDEVRLAHLLADTLNDPGKRTTTAAKQRLAVQQYDVAHVGPRIVAQYRSALHKRHR